MSSTLQSEIEQAHKYLMSIPKDSAMKSLLTFTTELDQFDCPVSYCLTGEIVDHDGHLFPVGEFSFKQTKAWDTLMYYTQNFDNVLVKFETKTQF